MTTSSDQLLPAIVPAPVLSITPGSAEPNAADLNITGPLSAHPAATLFPMMHGTDLGALVEDIEANGLREPIVIYDGQILDGRNRLRACELAGIAPRFVEWDGVGSPVAFVLSRNLHRRHLNESQRSIVAARAKSMFEEEAAEHKASGQFAEGNPGPSSEVRDGEKHREKTVCANLHKPLWANHESGALLNVSARSVATASKVLESGDELVIAAIDAGTISVSDAAAVVDLPKDAQREALDAVRRGRARTLRHAAKIELPDELPPPAAASDDDEPPFSRKRLRVECKRFSIELDKLVRRVDAVALACGGPNDYTKRARDCLSVALRAIHECVNHFGRRTRN